ncbi:MAG: methylmalonyl-CoA mutase [Candidatus Geothermarchaeales archaeon]
MFKEVDLQRIRRERENWGKGVLKRSLGERKKEFTTYSWIPIKGVYTPLDLKDFNYVKDLGFPGEYPYTRGIEPTMYRGKLWTMHQYMGFGSPESTNRRIKYLLSLAAKPSDVAASLALDLPTQIGLDSDHPMARGEIGRIGVSINSLHDIETIFKGIPIEKLGYISTTANAIGPIFMAWIIGLCEKRGIYPNNVHLYIQNDILKEYCSRGTYIVPPGAGVKLAVDAIEYCVKQNFFNWLPIMFCGYHQREAGSQTAASEVAFAFANAFAYVKEGLERGLSVDECASFARMFLSSGIDFFEEIAKFRAARRLWARLMRERFGAKNPVSLKLRFLVFTRGGDLTAQQPLNNIVRVTIQALAAVLGGVQYVHCTSYDEALCIPSEEAMRVAIRTQQIIAHESGVANVVDPVGGSYYVEWLTDRIEEEVRRIIEEIDDMGGAVAALEKGYFHKKIAEGSYRYQMEIKNKEKILVGVNEYTEREEPKIEIFKVNPKEEERRIEIIKKLKRERNDEKVEKALKNLRKALNKGENTVDPLLRAIKAHSTLGEICDIFREIYGEYTPPTIF